MIFKEFGKKPGGSHLEKIKQSPNYREGAFQNLSKTIMMTEKGSYFKMLYEFINKPKDTVPPKKLPSVRTDLKNLKSEKPVIIWFGHSSYLIHTNGKNILVDPV